MKHHIFRYRMDYLFTLSILLLTNRNIWHIVSEDPFKVSCGLPFVHPLGFLLSIASLDKGLHNRVTLAAQKDNTEYLRI